MKEDLQAALTLIKMECKQRGGRCMWCDLAESIVKNGKQYWLCRITWDKEPRNWDDI